MKTIACRLAVMALLLLATPTVWAADWPRITPEQLAATQATVTPGADAEALLWEVWIEDTHLGSELQTHYRNLVQLKLFNERAVDDYKQIDIEYDEDAFVSEVAARTIKPDGTILELDKGDVFERTIVKSGKRKVKAKSFALPGLEPGVIVEYQWITHRIEHLANYQRLDFQREVPVRLLRYHIKPLSWAMDLGYKMQIQYFQQAPVPIEGDLTGFSTLELVHVPAFHREPHMVPSNALRRWALIYYTDHPGISPEKFWPKYAGDMFDEQKRKPSREVAAAARAAVAGATTAEEKAARLIQLCRSKIKRVDDDASDVTREQRKKLKKDRRPKEVLQSGMGTGRDVLRLFLALAAAVNLDARYAELPDHSRSIFDPRFPNGYFLVRRTIAYKGSDGWRFCDPAAMYLPAGLLRWQQEGQLAVIADPDGAPMVPAPVAAPDKSRARRQAHLTLGVDGTIEGDVREEYSGHLAAYFKETYDNESAREREESLTNEVRQRLSTAEITNVGFENVTDAEKPLVRTFHVRVPSYGQRTGRRIFFQPSFFETRGEAVFPASTREHPIGIEYAWSEEDHVTVTLPAGYELESADLPGPASSAPVAEYKTSARAGNGTLDFDRTFYFGGEGRLMFPLELYGKLKAFFDHVRSSDDHTLTLKKVATAPAGQP